MYTQCVCGCWRVGCQEPLAGGGLAAGRRAGPHSGRLEGTEPRQSWGSSRGPSQPSPSGSGGLASFQVPALPPWLSHCHLGARDWAVSFSFLLGDPDSRSALAKVLGHPEYLRVSPVGHNRAPWWCGDLVFWGHVALAIQLCPLQPPLSKRGEPEVEGEAPWELLLPLSAYLTPGPQLMVFLSRLDRGQAIGLGIPRDSRRRDM